ncbi:hypothetical protein EPN44_09425 [bacterium]|nr:MAG: hypothetical protein EPN44_09425 [bacterium]
MNARRGFTALLIAVTMVAAATARVRAATGSVEATWKTAVIISMTVAPNFQSGFGPQGGPSSPAPAAGPSAIPGGGYVDFGKVVQGYNYLYKYAAQVAVLTNDSSGFQVFAEGSSDFTSASSGTWPIDTTLFWLPSNGTNTPYAAAVPFSKTSAMVTGSGATTGISYGAGLPPSSALVWSYAHSTIGLPSNSATQGYDYQLRLSGGAPVTQFSVYVVYTVVAK